MKRGQLSFSRTLSAVRCQDHDASLQRLPYSTHTAPHRLSCHLYPIDQASVQGPAKNKQTCGWLYELSCCMLWSTHWVIPRVLSSSIHSECSDVASGHKARCKAERTDDTRLRSANPSAANSLRYRTGIWLRLTRSSFKVRSLTTTLLETRWRRTPQHVSLQRGRLAPGLDG